MGNQNTCSHSKTAITDVNSTIKTDQTPSVGSLSSSLCSSSSKCNISVNQYLSKRLISVAVSFWVQNIELVSMEDKLELGCSIFFTMISMDKEIQLFMQSDTKREAISLKHLEMLGWLLRSLSRSDIDLNTLLNKIGSLHRRINIKRKHFNVMIKALHETMTFYFPTQYDSDVQYAMEQIIILAAKSMACELTESDPNENSMNTAFLNSLEACLSSNIGRAYLYDYLQKNWCSEFTVYLDLIHKFRKQKTNKQRYIVAKDLMKLCIDPMGKYAINISYEARTELLDSFEEMFMNQSEITIDYFKNVQMEMRRLIIKNYWNNFVTYVSGLYANVDYCYN